MPDHRQDRLVLNELVGDSGCLLTAPPIVPQDDLEFASTHSAVRVDVLDRQLDTAPVHRAITLVPRAGGAEAIGVATAGASRE